MSILPVTTSSPHVSMDNQQPSHQYRALLFIEALAGVMIIMGIIFILATFVLDQHLFADLDLANLFGILSCTSAITLFASIYSAAQKHQCLIQTWWHMLFHMPFLITIGYLGYSGLKGPFKFPSMCFPLLHGVYTNDLFIGPCSFQCHHWTCFHHPNPHIILPPPCKYDTGSNGGGWVWSDYLECCLPLDQ